jgi:hypothetical protein
VSWDFGRFLIVLAPLLPLVRATYLVIPPAVGTSIEPLSPREHYHAAHRMVFALLAAWVALGTVAELALVEPALHLEQLVRLLAVTLLLALGSTARPALHWAGLVVLVNLQLFFIRIVTPVLG